MTWILDLDKALAAYDVSHVADWTSLLSILVSLFGFGLTLIGVFKSKQAAEQARDAARRAVRTVAIADVLSELGHVVSLCERAKDFQRREDWSSLPDVFTEMRKRLIVIKNSNAELSAEIVPKIEVVLQGCREGERVVSRFIKTPPKPGALQSAMEKVRDLYDDVHELNALLKKAAGTQ